MSLTQQEDDNIKNIISKVVNDPEGAKAHASVGGISLSQLKECSKYLMLSYDKHKSVLIDNIVKKMKQNQNQQQDDVVVVVNHQDDHHEEEEEEGEGGDKTDQGLSSWSVEEQTKLRKVIRQIVKHPSGAKAHATSGGVSLTKLKECAKFLMLPSKQHKEELVDAIVDKMKHSDNNVVNEDEDDEEEDSSSSDTEDFVHKFVTSGTEENLLNVVNDIATNPDIARAHVGSGGMHISKLKECAKFLGIPSKKSKDVLVDSIARKVLDIRTSLQDNPSSSSERDNGTISVIENHTSNQSGVDSTETAQSLQDIINYVVRNPTTAKANSRSGGVSLDNLKNCARLLGIAVSKHKPNLVDSIVAKVTNSGGGISQSNDNVVTLAEHSTNVNDDDDNDSIGDRLYEAIESSNELKRELNGSIKKGWDAISDMNMESTIASVFDRIDQLQERFDDIPEDNRQGRRAVMLRTELNRLHARYNALTAAADCD